MYARHLIISTQKYLVVSLAMRTICVTSYKYLHTCLYQCSHWFSKQDTHTPHTHVHIYMLVTQGTGHTGNTLHITNALLLACASSIHTPSHTKHAHKHTHKHAHTHHAHTHSHTHHAHTPTHTHTLSTSKVLAR